MFQKHKIPVMLAVVASLFSGCKPDCYDSSALNFGATSNGGNCSYSQIVWYVLRSDSVYAQNPGILPMNIYIDHNTDSVGVIDSAAITPGNICDNTILPSGFYLISSTLNDGNLHTWHSKSANSPIIFNDTVRANTNSPCISFPL